MFRDHFEKNRTHDNIHFDTKLRNVAHIHRDRSCDLCYLPEHIETSNFNSFWNWYHTEYPCAISYTIYTQQYFEELKYSEGNDIWLTIIDLIYTIRYTYIPDGSFEALQQHIWNAYATTQGFQLDPFSTLYAHSDTDPLTPRSSSASSSRESLTPVPQEPAFDIFHEDLNLYLLFQPPELMAQAQQADIQALRNAVQALTQAIPGMNQALAANTQAVGNPPRREGRVADLPLFCGGNQDPVAWLEEFTRACNANGIANARKLEVMPAYLKGAASTWWNANQALPNGNANKIVAWDGNVNNTDFILNFPNAFRTQTLIEIWTTKLEQRRQQPGEDVNTYAAALQELYRRVETNAFNYPEAIKARKFVNGLLPDLYVTVKPHNDQTWNAAVDRAKAYELTHQDQNAVSAYINKFAPHGTNTQSEDLFKAIQELTKQVQQLSSGNRSYNRNNNYSNNNYRGNQQSVQPQQVNRMNKVVCYACDQPGHIVRNCPNRNNNKNMASLGNNNNSSTQNNHRIPSQVPTVNNKSDNQLAQIQQMLAQLVSQEEEDQSLN